MRFDMYTKGPWHIGMRSGANSSMIYAYDGENMYEDNSICSVYRMYQHCDLEDQKDQIGIANAKLIAAAPDLLEAMQAIINSVPFGSSHQATFDRARTAIRKATE